MCNKIQVCVQYVNLIENTFVTEAVTIFECIFVNIHEYFCPTTKACKGVSNAVYTS